MSEEINLGIFNFSEMQSEYKVHEGFHISESTLVEEYCHCVPPENVSVAEVYYKNLSDEHNLAFEKILERLGNNSMYDAAHIDWEHLMLGECDL